MKKPYPSDSILRQLMHGAVIPAHPLALTSERRFDERRQRALTRYYCETGAGGLAVGVHTTQFEIRNPEIGLYEPVLSLAADTIKSMEAVGGETMIKVAGIAGDTRQAVKEAELAVGFGYQFGLVNLGYFKEVGNAELIAHLEAVSEVISLFGFYLQPSAGGRKLDYSFWRMAMEIENLVAIKVAPFDRYETLDVIRAVSDSGRGGDLALYTGNDDNIILDLLATYSFHEGEGSTISFRGGLLGQWAIWTRRAVLDFEAIREIRENSLSIPAPLLTLAQQLTDANAAIFDSTNQFAGCIPGIHEILRRQGLLEGRWTLNPNEELSPGQMEAIDRVYRAYPGLNDDNFVKENLDRWLS